MTVVDGDKSLVVADETLIKVAKRNMKGIVPLYYNMKKASPCILTMSSIYDGLSNAFTGSNIGSYSNNISKIWNSGVFQHGTEEEKKEALDIIKLLCMENNYCIDRAKTLYMPERPNGIKERIVSYTKRKLPHFFTYAKDKDDVQVEEPNESFVNKIGNVIPNPRISCKYLDEKGKDKRLGKPDCRLMMDNPDLKVKVVKSKNGDLAEGTNPVILKYRDMARMLFQKIDATKKIVVPIDVLKKSEIRENLLYGDIRKKTLRELSQFGYTDEEITDILVWYLYSYKDSKFKDLFWICYGSIVYERLQRNVKPVVKDIQCSECGDWFEVVVHDNSKKMCSKCYMEHRKKYKAQKEKERRSRMKNQA